MFSVGFDAMFFEGVGWFYLVGFLDKIFRGWEGISNTHTGKRILVEAVAVKDDYCCDMIAAFTVSSSLSHSPRARFDYNQ